MFELYIKPWCFVNRTVANYIVWKVVLSSVYHLSDAVFLDITQRFAKVRAVFRVTSGVTCVSHVSDVCCGN